jgi:hypothetical protein
MSASTTLRNPEHRLAPPTRTFPPAKTIAAVVSDREAMQPYLGNARAGGSALWLFAPTEDRADQLVGFCRHDIQEPDRGGTHLPNHGRQYRLPVLQLACCLELLRE